MLVMKFGGTSVACAESIGRVTRIVRKRLQLQPVVVVSALAGVTDALQAMGALGTTALVDFLAYFLVGEVTVCYSCHAIYRGFTKNPEHEPFDLKKLEKYGGRTPRF